MFFTRCSLSSPELQTVRRVRSWFFRATRIRQTTEAPSKTIRTITKSPTRTTTGEERKASEAEGRGAAEPAHSRTGLTKDICTWAQGEDLPRPQPGRVWRTDTTGRGDHRAVYSPPKQATEKGRCRTVCTVAICVPSF